MPASTSATFHPARFHPLCSHYYAPLIPASRSAALPYLPPLHPTLQSLKSPLSSSRSLNFPATAAAISCRRSSSIVVSAASSEKLPEIITHASSILAIITFIWRLPSFVARFFEKEEKLLDTVEEDIIKASDAVKVGTKVVEELAEGLEEVAEGIEKEAKKIDKDAKKVDEIMDKVKEKTKIGHDELEEVARTLEGSRKGMEKDSAKVEIGLKKSKEIKVTTEDITNDSNMVEALPSSTNTIYTNSDSAKNSKYKPLAYPTLLGIPYSVLYILLHSLQWPLFHVHSQSLFYFMPPHRFISRAMLMVSSLFFIGAISNVSLASYVF